MSVGTYNETPDVISQCEDKKGIRLEILHEKKTHTVIVNVSYQSKIIGAPIAVKTSKFPGNRFGVMLPDSMKAMEKAERMARELERELGL